jgi:hypothetical protein
MKKNRRADSTVAEAGEVFLIPLRDGGLAPFQIISQFEKSTLSVCSLFGSSFSSAEEATSAIVAGKCEVVAEITIPTSWITKKHPEVWPRLGRHGIHATPTVPRAKHRFFERILAKLGGRDLGLHFCSIGILYDLAHAYHGLAPWDGMADAEFYEQFLTAKGRSTAHRLFTKNGNQKKA